MRPGDVLFFHGALVHGSLPNVTKDRFRRSLIGHYIDGRARQVTQYDFQVATSYYGYDETERHFGLGNRTNVDVVVRFPSGRVTRINNVAANQTIRVLESAGA